LEELRDGFAEPDQAWLAALPDQALRLGRIISDLAELFVAESAALSLRPADLDAGVVVRADAGRIHQALGNQLPNAARYCRPGDTVTVLVRAGRDEAMIEVAGTGRRSADRLPAPAVPAACPATIATRLTRQARKCARVLPA
jgi:two-component system sensor histidine kinase BaeS